MKINRVKELLQRGEVTLGPWITIGHPDVVELLAHMGFDWMTFDMEHAPLDLGTVQNLMQAANGTEVTPFVRVAWNDIVLIKQVLDLGTQGLVVPWVNTRKTRSERFELPDTHLKESEVQVQEEPRCTGWIETIWLKQRLGL